jgi:hypothetical protein
VHPLEEIEIRQGLRLGRSFVGVVSSAPASGCSRASSANVEFRINSARRHATDKTNVFDELMLITSWSKQNLIVGPDDSPTIVAAMRPVFTFPN